MIKEKEKLLVLIGLITLAKSYLKSLKECEESICKVGGVPPDKTSGEYWLDGIWGDIDSPVKYAKDIIKYKRG